MAHDVFISHASVDKPAADAVCHGLEARGVRCWIAPRDQIAGKPYGQQITEAIRAARVMVLIFSEHVNASQAVLNEIHLAAAAEVTIVPFRIARVDLNPELNYYLGRTHWLDAFPQPLDAYIDTLAATIQRNLPGEAATAGAAPAVEAPADDVRGAPSSRPGAPPMPAHPQRPNNAPLFVFGGLVAIVLLGGLLVALAALVNKPTPAEERAKGVIAQAVANAIAEGVKEDQSLPPAARDAARQASNDAGGDQ